MSVLAAHSDTSDWKHTHHHSLSLSVCAAMLLPGLPVATLKYKVMFRLQQMLCTEGWQHIAEIAVPLAQDFHIVLEQVRSHST